MLLKSCLGFTLIAFLFLLGHTLALERKKTEIKGITKTEKGKKTKNSKPNKDAAVLRKSRVINTPIRNEPDCTEIGGICQEHTYICQGRYLKNLKCSGAKKQQCCVPAAAWDVLCAGTHQNRVRACDRFGCGGFNTKSDGALHKAVDVVCDDFGIINAPFSGILGGPVGRKVGVFQYDGIKLSNSVHCVKIFNVRPYRYTGPIGQGQALGYLLPIQESFSGITSHLELQMCDQSDPTPFI